MWSKVLKTLAEFDVIARWYWRNEGYIWMAIPDKNEILDNGFSPSIESPRDFTELCSIEIDRLFQHGNVKQKHDIDSIFDSIQKVPGVNAKIENDILSIKPHNQQLNGAT